VVSGHSPAPWTLHEPEPGDKVIEITGKTLFYGGGTIAEIPRDDCDYGEALANARLIAAAPDLLVALEAALVALRRPMGPEFGTRGRDFGLRETITEVIAKATA
jgi:hypothetical protein